MSGNAQSAPTSALSLAAANRLPPDEFVARFGDIAEHSPWVAKAVMDARPFPSRAAMQQAFAKAIFIAGREAQLALLRAHPDLAGKAAVAGELTDDSRREQAGAGLDRLTPAEHARFTELNRAYMAKHGIPFIIAVRGKDKDAIMAAMAERLAHDSETEFAEALQQVARIMALRIGERVEP